MIDEEDDEEDRGEDLIAAAIIAVAAVVAVVIVFSGSREKEGSVSDFENSLAIVINWSVSF